MLVTDPIIANNYNGSAFMALVVGLTLFFGLLPPLMVILLQLVIWNRNLRSMPESRPQLLVLWLCGTVFACLCLLSNQSPPRVLEQAWATLIVLTFISVISTLFLIRWNQQLNTWTVWSWWIILPGIVLSSASVLMLGD